MSNRDDDDDDYVVIEGEELMLKVPTVRKTYVTLKHFEYTYAHLELLKNIQQLAPNLPLEVVPPDQHVHLKQFIAAFNLDLDDLKLIRRLNP